MMRMITAVVLIPLVLLAVFKAPLWLFAGLTGVVALMATHEYLRILKGFPLTPLVRTTYAVVVLVFSVVIVMNNSEQVFFITPIIVFVLAMCVVPVYLVLAMSAPDLTKALPDAAASALALPYIAIPFVCLSSLKAFPGGWFLVLYLLLTVWSGDIFAYFVGRAWGKHRLAPRISPKKSWEGAIASAVGAVLVGMLWRHFAPALSVHLARAGWISEPLENSSLLYPLASFAGLTIALNIAAQLGDLAESMIKRGAGIKDSGAIIPGHGGVLDRIDALLFSAPLVWYYALYCYSKGV